MGKYGGNLGFRMMGCLLVIFLTWVGARVWVGTRKTASPAVAWADLVLRDWLGSSDLQEELCIPVG